MIVTEEDAAHARLDSPYWSSIAQVIGNRPVIVVGHSLRDENARRVLVERGSGAGLYVSIASDPMDEILRDRFGLAECVGTADDFLQSYEYAHRQAESGALTL
ncbi:hypothetical protein X759_12195 [Mesorhizobium sp. LSHC420B00]|nr:hypothetical protein X759_12195 [Mesorhizobium sp. LSHC420B00]